MTDLLRFRGACFFLTLIPGVAIPVLGNPGVMGQTAVEKAVENPVVFTNERLIDVWSKRSTLDLEDTTGIFRFVFDALPDRVRVYPTENYYYFYFYRNGVRYAGNIRLDVDGVREGTIAFAYFRDSTLWANDEQDWGAILGVNEGVVVRPAGKLAHEVTFEGKSVIFVLNDLSKVKPPESILHDGEIYLGPVFDESGIRFFLIFDKARKLFHYVLDETVPVNDELIAQEGLMHTVIGWRTGFAFFKDQKLDRRILIAVFSANVDVNNYLDGPFDQLPDNFIKDDELRQALLAVHPELKGRIDRFGNAPDRKSRELIAPYIDYGVFEELRLAETCALEESNKTVRDCVEDRFVPE